MSKRSPVPSLCLAAAALLFAACGPAGDEAAVARAGEYDLTVNEAVRMITGAGQLPNEPQMVEALAELWIDYTLLAEVARRDTTMASADVGPLVDQQEEALLIIQLRDTAVMADTAISDAQLEELYREETPGLRVRARHILLSTPPQATEAQRDSVRAELDLLRDRILAGEDFEELARTYSDDTGSAPLGGDLNFFRPGELVRPIEEVAFSLEPGELSEVFSSPYGFHILRVDEREEPTFDEIREQYRRQVQQRRQREAETGFVQSIQEDGRVEPSDEAAELTRQVARDPGVPLQGRAARRPVVKFRGGTLTLDDVRAFMQTVDPQYRQRVVDAPDDDIVDQVLMPLVQRELLLHQARERGLTLDAGVRDSLSTEARSQFREAAELLGFLQIEPVGDESPQEAVERHVGQLMIGILNGQLQAVPLGGVAYALREQFDHEVSRSAIALTVERVNQARGASPARPSSSPDSSGDP